MRLLTRARTCAAFFLALLVLLGCSTARHPPIEAGPAPDLGPKPRRLDLVIITSPRHTSYGWKVGSAVEALTRRLFSKAPGLDFHLGVVSAALHMTPEICNIWEEGIGDARFHWTSRKLDHWLGSWPPPTDGYFTAEMQSNAGDFPVDLSYLIATEVRRLEVGICGVTQFLETALMATDGRNPGFLRPDSLLAILILADQDDCSLANAEIWDEESWKHELMRPVRCYEPPDGLLYPLGRYLDNFSSLHRGGRVFLPIVTMPGEPTIEISPYKYDTDYLLWVRPLCADDVLPSRRLPRFVDAVNARNDPRVSAEVVEGSCRLVELDYAPFESIADEVLSRLTLDQSPDST